MARTHDEFGQVIFMDHPETPSQRPITERQWQMLYAVCKTNGGGVSRHDWPRDVIRGLMDRHLIQGKAGGERIVHTREGLVLYRERTSA